MKKELAQKYTWSQLEIGVCYYPEHWDKSLWKQDLKRMKENGITTIRIAEFSWNKFEAQEGVFTFDFWDSFLDLATEFDMKVIFCTPTATPPRWLTKKYPECLNADKYGHRFRHGARRHYNYNSPKYRELSAKIVEQLAIHYGKHPQIVGWQIDNEFNCEISDFYSESDERAFRVYLKKKYGTLQALNKAWGTEFWNQGYTEWDDISFPIGTANNGYNPHQKLNYLRFVSNSVLEYVELQSEILRKYIKPGVFITTNGMFGHLDNHRMEREYLDVYTYDSYPDFAYGLIEDVQNNSTLLDRKWNKNLSEVRSICPNFGIMEQQSGANGWNNCMEAPAPKPGQMMLWAMQSVAQGADFVSFFRWRTCCIGTEIYWHGILDYDNRDNRKLQELRQISQRFEKIKDITGAENIPAFGVIHDYDNLWDTECDVWHSRVYWHSESEIFVASELTHTPFDYIQLGQSDTEQLLNPQTYPVLFYPHATILRPEWVKLLTKYVEDGGTLILGCRTGYKDSNGHCIMEPMPGLLRDIAGCNVRDFTFIGPADEKETMSWSGNSYSVPIFNDVLEVEENSRCLGTFENNYYKESPALVEHPVGKGRVLTLGAAFDRELVIRLLEYTGVIHPFEKMISGPEEVGITVRRKEDKSYLFVLNFSNQQQSINLHSPMTDVDSGQVQEGKYVLKPYESKIYTYIH